MASEPWCELEIVRVEGTLNATRVAKRYAVGRNVRGHDAPGTNDSICADGYARHDDGTCANPDAIIDDNRPSLRAIRRLSRSAVVWRNDSFLGVERMRNG